MKKRNLHLFFYYSLCYNLPNSFFPLGWLFNKIRTKTLKKLVELGEKCKVQSKVYIGNGNNISIGNYCQINENVKLDNVTIGNYVMIAPGVTILGKMHEFNSISIPMIMQGEKEVERTIIEDDVWIGTNCIIMPGLKIAKGTILGAGCVLTKSTVEYGIYGGIPARLIKIRK